jgi:membrane protein implicated in regulation of membrane protease activity
VTLLTVPVLGNHGLWLALAVFLALRGLSLALIWREKHGQRQPQAVIAEHRDRKQRHGEAGRGDRHAVSRPARPVAGADLAPPLATRDLV